MRNKDTRSSDVGICDILQEFSGLSEGRSLLVELRILEKNGPHKEHPVHSDLLKDLLLFARNHHDELLASNQIETEARLLQQSSEKGFHVLVGSKHLTSPFCGGSTRVQADDSMDKGKIFIQLQGTRFQFVELIVLSMIDQIRHDRQRFGFVGQDLDVFVLLGKARVGPAVEEETPIEHLDDEGALFHVFETERGFLTFGLLGDHQQMVFEDIELVIEEAMRRLQLRNHHSLWEGRIKGIVWIRNGLFYFFFELQSQLELDGDIGIADQLLPVNGQWAQ